MQVKAVKAITDHRQIESGDGILMRQRGPAHGGTPPAQPQGEAGLPARKNNRFRKKDDSENMDIPVMPHPGTDTQASPYQSRQTKEIT